MGGTYTFFIKGQASGDNDTEISFPLKNGKIEKEINHWMSGYHDDAIIMYIFPRTFHSWNLSEI